MPDTGANWGAWAAVAKSGGGDWTNLDVADNGNAGSGAISLDGIAALEIGFDLYEDNTGAVDGDVTVYIMGDVDGTNYQGAPSGAYDATVIASAFPVKVRPVQNKHFYDRFVLSGLEYSSIRLWILNEAGQTLTTTFKYRTATIPLATA
ncbi:MAG: hypothetical protein EHM35_15495 [Planctomycetaceae bacterium]|nr:MAG: hypothetical protein EHM35_15495 [Planctomycetaceae bacterium]